MDNEEVGFQTIVNWLTAGPICKGLLPDEIARIAEQVGIRSFAEGEILSTIGQEMNEFWILAEGTVEASFEDLQGHEHVLGDLGPGDTIGEVALFEKTPRPARFVAQSSGKLLTITGSAFHVLIETYPVLMHNLYRKLSARYKDAIGLSPRRLTSRRLAIVASSGRAHILAGRIAGRLLSVGERLAACTDHSDALRNTSTWPKSLPVAELQPHEYPFSVSVVPNVDRQIVVLSSTNAKTLDFRRVQNCDEVLWLLEPQASQSTMDELRRAIRIDESLRQKLRIVWLLGDKISVAPSDPGINLAKSDIKAPVETNGNNLTRLESQGLDRVVRALRGYSLGIALAGGGAKCMAHLGVLRVLEEAGLSFDTMSGASAGAMAGIIYASGMSADVAAEHFQRDLTPSRLFRTLPGWPNLYLLMQFRKRAWDRMLRRYLHDWRLEQLSIPFAALTVDLIQGRSVVRREGDAVHAILESINLPVLSKPILRDGMALVDGGMLDNLPADVLSSNGCDFVIGVDVSRRLRHQFAGNRPDTPTDKMKNASSLDTLFRIFESQAHNLSAIHNRAVDFWIAPDTSSIALADFYRSKEIAAVGEAAARSALPDLQARLMAMEKRLFG